MELTSDEPGREPRRGDHIRIATPGHSAADLDAVVEEVLGRLLRVRLPGGRSAYYVPAAGSARRGSRRR